MNALAKAYQYFRDLGRRPPMETQTAAPEPAFHKPRPMTGLWNTLTDEQKAYIKGYSGSDTVGDPSHMPKEHA